MRLVERFTCVNADTIKYEGTVIDPATYAVPWRLSLMNVRLSGARADSKR